MIPAASGRERTGALEGVDEGTGGRPIVIELSSRLAADADAVWDRVTTPEGINAELMPLVRMTFPPGKSLRDLGPEQMGKPLFASCLLAFGFIPFDRHVLVIERIEPRAFFERSHTLLQRRWNHDRKIVPDGAHCILTDRVEMVPRVRLSDPVTGWLVRRIFEHRHARLRKTFGGTPHRRP